MRTLLVLCIIGFAGMALARPEIKKSRMPFGYKNIRSGGGAKRPLSPLNVLLRQHGLSKSTKKGSPPKILPPTCAELCPPARDIEPCACKCTCNSTGCLANINCGQELETRFELKKILSLTTYPIRNYSSLLVESTFLDGAITKDLLGTSVGFNEINIHHNGFSYIDTHAFNKSGPILKKLYLNNNQISQLDWTLRDMPNLKQMDVSCNRLSFIPGDAMHNENLHFLNISHNDIGDVGISAFKGLPKLSHLDLSHNALTELGSSSLALINHEDIRLVVNLSHNQINKVEKSAIIGGKLMHINMTWNQMKTINEEVFRHFIDLTDGSIHIDVAGNPVECDCRLAWIVRNSTVSNCFDDFPVCKSTISQVTTDNLGDC
ncbi:unnamed protein product [Meganyctiphanes norvegica]|uniref:Uncharacterized protein n=1 Tax=Meganyctiphanes norvegica TaxID=48144 RepID=A0AAV2QEW8_MEGNR